MTTKEYLQQVYRIEEQIASKQEQICLLKALALKTTNKIKETFVSGSKSTSTTEELIIKIINLELLINEDIDRLVDIKSELVKTLKKMDDTDCRLILEYRYLNYYQWEEIAEKMHYTVRWVYKLHGRALEKLEKVLKAGT